MNWDQVQGKWKQYKGQAQSQWGDMTEDDWNSVQGRKESLVGKIQERYGVGKERAEKEVDDWLKKLD